MPSPSRAGPDRAADTVIGFVLVTGISVAMISVVMLTGLPALDNIQARQQADSMVGSFQRLDRAVTQLISGSPRGTTPAWQVSMARGSLDIPQGGEQVWGYAVNYTKAGNDYHFEYGKFADETNPKQLQIHNDGAGFSSNEFRVKAWRWDADSSTGPHVENATSLANGDDYTVDLPWTIAEQSTQIQILDEGEGGEVVAEAWFIDAGAVEWSLSSSQLTHVYYQNTGIIMDIDDGQVLHNQPRVRTPDTQGSGESIFFRVVKIEGSLAVGGRSSAEILLSSEGSHSRFSSGDVGEVQIYPPTSTMESWKRRLTDTTRGYTYSWDDDPGGFGTDEAMAFRSNSSFDGDLSSTMVETDITMSLQGTGG